MAASSYERRLHNRRQPSTNEWLRRRPYAYTSGRWLRLDEQQILARHVVFNFDKLCEKAIACSPGARDISRCTKIEGGFNRAFILELDNGASLVARVPFANAALARLATNSEVATMDYIRKHTSIPVPDVLDWSDNVENPTQTEYIIMAHAAGVQLHHKWPTMNTHQHMLAVKALAKLSKQMSLLQFPAYGSLYFANAPIDKSSAIRISDNFCIGPHCGSRYWSGIPGDERSYQRRPHNSGPWSSHEEYIRGLIDLGISRIPMITPSGNLEVKGTVDEHLDLISAAEKVLLRLAQSDELKSVERPTLLHHNMHKRNIFVSDDDPSQITCIIDWQSTSIQPVHTYSDEMPDLCELPDTWDETEIDDPLNKEQEKTMADVSICRQTWEIAMRGYVPDLHKARTMDQDFLRLSRFAPSAWRHGAAAIREDLMQLSRRWSNELSLPGSCPYQPTAEELARQKALWKDFKTMQDVRSEIFRGLATDEEGWIPIDRWEATAELHSSLFREWLETAVSTGELTDDVARKIWPFEVGNATDAVE